MTAEKGTVNILVVDDERLVRAGLVAIVSTDESLRVVAECASGEDVLDAVRRHRVDVVLLDIRMEGIDGLRTLETLRRDTDGIRVLMVTTFGEDAYIAEAIRLGADGFLLKSGDPRELLLAVHAVVAGGAYFSPAISRKLLDSRVSTRFIDHSDASERFARLTKREQDVLVLIGDGLSNAEIASRLFLSEGTVKTHITSILRSTGARNRVEAALIAAHARPTASAPPAPQPAIPG